MYEVGAMEYLPNLKVNVIYPAGKKLSKTTIFNVKIHQFEEKLINKVSNEFKHCLRNYNPYNFIDDKLSLRYVSFLDDYNDYSCFQRS